MRNAILLVDDCKENLENVHELLELEGYEVMATTDPQRAYLIALTSYPALIISDINMKGMTGLELIHLLRLKKETREIPFIFHTAHSELAMIQLGLQLGASDYIIMPSCISRLYDSIKQTLAT
ncbi:MAG: response regulator [Bacteroidota bacterium]